MFGRSGLELLLELMLLDAQLVLPRDAFSLKASAAASGAGVKTGGLGSMALSRGPVECVLSVLVSRAENLPLVRG